MQKLQLPEYSFRIRKRDAGDLIFDEFRHRWVALTPEEWVRQHFLKYLSDEKKCPPSLMAVEKKVDINELQQRFDLLVYDRSGNPLMVAEFKAPHISVTQAVFDQALRYNSVLRAPYFLISNGFNHFICRIDYLNRLTSYLREIPSFDDMVAWATPE
ncbi:MAG: type I restriction enzyme HsdR N-terminal domain-containing protein [Prolixibacteraceae bacterium]|jgi:hypothetical protein